MSEERYRIEGKIGRGGIGAVFRAYDNQLGRPVAIKRMLPPEESDMADPEEASGNLLKEAKVLSTLNHPNIVTVFDVGADSKGVFVVMELLNGETLDELVSRGVLTSEDFSEVVVQTLEALIAAQDIDLVHRDIKPGNVMVVWLPSGKFQIKVLDFGLAKFSARPSVQTSDQGDAIMGSIFFMAPEQFERGALDGRTDLYSLGCIYYHCLTGKYPFQGETAAQVMASHLQNRMVPLEKYRPDLPAWICNWVKWLLQRDMNMRPADAKTALEHYMNETVGHPELQRATEEAERAINAGVSVVTPGKETTGLLVPVVAAAAAPPMLATARSATATGAIPVTGATTGVTVLPPAPKSSKAKWIAIGVSAVLILGVGSYILLDKMATAKEQQEWKRLVDNDVPFGDAETVRWMLRFLDPKHPNAVRDETTRALSRMQGDGVDEELLAQLDNFQGVELVALLRCITVRGYAAAVPRMVEIAASTTNVDVQKSALNGITIMGRAEHIGGLLNILKTAKDDKVKESATTAVLTLAQSVDGEQERAALFLKELESADGAYRKSLLEILGYLGGSATLAKFKDILERGAQDYREDVLFAMRNWPDADAAGMLQKLAEETKEDFVRLAASRAYIRLVGIPAARTPAQLQEMLDVAWSLADDRKEKSRVFGILAGIPQDWATEYVGKLMEDPQFKAQAKRTQDLIRERIGNVAPLESGKPLEAKKENIGGSFGAAYSENLKALTNWRDPRTWISWDFIVEEPGTYGVKITQSIDGHAGSTYEVIVGNNALAGTVMDTRDNERFMDVELGSVDLPEPGIYTLTVKPKGTAKTFIMNLRSVTLTKK